MNVKCDDCDCEFEVHLNTRTIKRDIQLAYFVCSHCQHEYHSFYTNAKIRTRRDKIKELWAKARQALKEDKLKQIIRRIDELVQQNKEEMNRLRERFEGGKR
jgi:ABC-type oligopeptide transport system ATPase subunit